MNDKTHSILDRFPDKSDMINSLMTKDPEFLAIYEDHARCVNALQYWVLSKEPEAESRVDEYRNLIQELEEEIVQALAEQEPR
jgi:uncharacterized protein YdcH (DUF465 family)